MATIQNFVLTIDSMKNLVHCQLDILWILNTACWMLDVRWPLSAVRPREPRTNGHVDNRTASICHGADFCLDCLCTFIAACRVYLSHLLWHNFPVSLGSIYISVAVAVAVAVSVPLRADVCIYIIEFVCLIVELSMLRSFGCFPRCGRHHQIDNC